MECGDNCVYSTSLKTLKLHDCQKKLTSSIWMQPENVMFCVSVSATVSG